MGPMALLAAEEATFDPDITITPPEDLGEATSILKQSLEGLVGAFVRALPLIGIGILILLLGLVLALSVAGVPVGAALAGLGLAGLAITFALQSILENFVAGVLLIIRKPITHGELIIIPNAEVFSSTIVNLTRRGRRRSRIVVGIDYRDDHNAAGGLTQAAVTLAPGVLDSPAPQARCIALGESSVDFEIRYWTAPDIASVVDTQDAVLRGVKSAIENAGMNIPWPIRTLSFDNVLTHAASNGDGP